MVPLPTPDGPATTSRTPRARRRSAEALEQRFALVAPEPAQAPALADIELLHQPARPDLAHARKGLEHAHDLQLGEGLVAVGLLEEIGRAHLELQSLRHIV